MTDIFYNFLKCSFFNENYNILIHISLLSLGSNCQYVLVDADNGWVPHLRQAIIMIILFEPVGWPNGVAKLQW